MKKINLIVWSLILSGSVAVAQKTNVPKKVEEVVDMLNRKDAKGLLSKMTDSSTIGNLPKMDNSIVLPEIMVNFSTITSFKVAHSNIKSDGNEFYALEVIYNDGKPGKPSLTFNRLGQIVNLGILKGKLTGKPEKALSESIASSNKPNLFRLPFKMDAGLIYVESVLNGKKGYFLFDSGAPVLILRDKFVPGNKIRSDISVDFAGLGGWMQNVVWSEENTLRVGDLELKNLDAPVTAMDDMELENGVTVFGIMGIGIAEGYQLTFDYGKQELIFERTDSNGEPIENGANKGNKLASYPMRLKRHIPIIDIKFGDKEYPMGIDCGANANVIKKDLEKDLKPYIEYDEENVKVNGVAGDKQGNSAVYMLNGKIGNLPLQQMYTVLTSHGIGAGEGKDALPIVGLLGEPFLNQYKITLNFVKHEISFYQ